MTTNYLTRKQFSQAKSRLTRATNVAEKSNTVAAWRKVIAVVDETYAEWDAGHYAWPDDWHRWERARDDARLVISHGLAAA